MNTTEPPQDRYGLVWPGKADARRLVSGPPEGALHPRRASSLGFEAARHTVVQGENLAVLRLLQPAYHGRVKLVCIDPPYNTGRNFIYPDDFRQSVSAWEQEAGPGAEVGGRYHSRWLTMMYPRLALARRLLRDDGLIAVSIDDREVHNLRLLLDEIFGPENFVAQLIWKKKAGGGGDVELFVTDHEYVLVYRRGPGATVGLDRDAQVTTSYPHVGEDGRRYSLERLDKRTLGYAESLDFPIEGPDGRTYRVHHADPKNKVTRWRWSQDSVRERYDELVFRGGSVYTRNYEKEGARPRSLLVDERFGRTRSGKADLKALFGADVHDFPKPVRLIAWLVSVMTGPDDLVLDFFAGAGTTGEAVLEANAKDGGRRRVVLVQLPHPTPRGSAARNKGLSTIAETCRERVSRALTARGCDDGLRSYEHVDAAVRTWSGAPNGLEAELHRLATPLTTPDREAAAHELALAAGVPLHASFEPVPSLGPSSWLADGLLLCLEDRFDAAMLAPAVALAPRRALLLDAAFAGDDALLLRLRRALERAGTDACWTV